MFYNCTNLAIVDLSSFSTNSLKDVGYMFQRCSSLVSVKFGSEFTLENAETTIAMFSYCENLEELDLSSFNTANVQNMEAMFANCYKLNNIAGIANLKTDNVKNMKTMFAGCNALNSLDLSGFNTTNVTNMGDMFNGCTSLETLNLNSFDLANVTDMNGCFADCTSLNNITLGNNFIIKEGINYNNIVENVPEATATLITSRIQ